MDREKVIKGLECCIRHGENAEVGCGRKDECPYEQNGLKCWLDLNRDALALLKEQEKLKGKLLQNIADNQLTVSPTGYETGEELAKRTGEWNGLQMAYEIVLNDGN